MKVAKKRTLCHSRDMARLPLWFGWLYALVVTAAAADLKLAKHSSPGPDWLVKLEHSPQQPQSSQNVQVTARVRSSITNAVLLYQIVEPGAYIELQDSAFTNNWVSLPMQPTGP